MIVSSQTGALSPQFESLLDNTTARLETDSIFRPDYYASRSGTQLEQDVFDRMMESAEGGPFAGSMNLVSGHSFPDITARGFYGVEVKSSKGPSWRTTGNSVLETTRIAGIDRIYLLFGKLSSPIGFRWRDYESCIYEVAVTHSPRYLIDMDTDPEDTIFSKIGLSYEDIRSSDNPIRNITRYYRTQLSEGEDVWWMDSGEPEPPTVDTRIRLWSNMNPEEKRGLLTQGMALFPEVFGIKNNKYRRFASWLVSQHGVVCTSLRDPFSAGGQASIRVGRRTHHRVPKVFERLRDNAKDIASQVELIGADVLEVYWGERPPRRNRVRRWTALVEAQATEALAGHSFSVSEMLRRELRL